ncbi:AAA family ATPase [Rothia nasimurium]|uniref:AAA family ATPase n=1 Tax=Rothia nasimurium TaxID=85336 RepID=UPI001F024529|nr:AAA family ATPase [Rothia nasimurium]
MKQITKITISELYGEYTHSINLNQKLTIIYGPNGVGKTTLLEISKLIVSGNFSKLSTIAFKDALIQYSDGSEIIFSKFEKGFDSDKLEITSSESLIKAPRSKDFNHFESSNAIIVYDSSLNEIYKWEEADQKPLIDWIEDNTSWNRINDSAWRDNFDGEVRSTSEILEMYEHKRPSIENSSENRFTESKIKFNPDAIHLIETQRLKIYDGKFNTFSGKRGIHGLRPYGHNETKIEQISFTIVEKIREAQRENSLISQKLERTFPSRVLSGGTMRNLPSESDVRKRYDSQMSLRDRLEKIIPNKDRLTSISLPERELNPSDITLLQIYLDDNEQKLAPFSNLVDKIELFTRIINERLSNKKISIDPKKGILLTKSNDTNIPLQSLSSGEQHEIILMAELIFNVQPGTLVLIDEPEISLHVSWQYKFIPDVLDISEVSKFKFLVATHSPQIIDNHMYLAQRLGESNLRWDEKN